MGPKNTYYWIFGASFSIQKPFTVWIQTHIIKFVHLGSSGHINVRRTIHFWTENEVYCFSTKHVLAYAFFWVHTELVPVDIWYKPTQVSEYSTSTRLLVHTYIFFSSFCIKKYITDEVQTVIYFLYKMNTVYYNLCLLPLVLHACRSHNKKLRHKKTLLRWLEKPKRSLPEVGGRNGMQILQLPKPLRRDWQMEHLTPIPCPSKSGSRIPSSRCTSWSRSDSTGQRKKASNATMFVRVVTQMTRTKVSNVLCFTISVYISTNIWYLCRVCILRRWRRWLRRWWVWGFQGLQSQDTKIWRWECLGGPWGAPLQAHVHHLLLDGWGPTWKCYCCHALPAGITKKEEMESHCFKSIMMKVRIKIETSLHCIYILYCSLATFSWLVARRNTRRVGKIGRGWGKINTWFLRIVAPKY